MGDRPRGHDLRVREEEAEPEGLRGRVVQVQHVAVAADDREDRVSIRKYSHRLCTSCESSVVVVVDVDTNVVDVFIDDIVADAVVNNVLFLRMLLVLMLLMKMLLLLLLFLILLLMMFLFLRMLLLLLILLLLIILLL